MMVNENPCSVSVCTDMQNPLFAFFHLSSEKKFIVLEIAIMLLALTLFTVFSISYWGFFQDDSYVILRYAHNLLEGNGLTFNPSEAVEGYTELLWTLLVAAGLAAHLPAIGLMKVLSMIFAVLALITLWLCARLQIGKPILNAVPSLFLAVNPSFVLWSQGGLGTTLFAFLILTHFYGLLRYFASPTRSNLCITSLSMMLAIFSRPEAVIYLGISAMTLLIKAHRNRRWLDVGIFLGASLTALIALYAFRLSYYSDFYPNTYYAKVSNNPMQWVHGAMEFYKGVVQVDFNFIFLLIPLCLLFRRRLSLGTVWLLAAIVMHTIYYIRIGTDLLPMNRLYHPTYAFLYLAFADVLASVSAHFQQGVTPIKRNMIAGSLSLICAAYASVLILSLLAIAPYRGVLTCLENAHGTIGRWLELHANPGDKVAVTDVGATSYYAKNLYILDLLGLTDRTVAHALHDTGYNPWLNYLSNQDLDYPKKEKAFEDKVKTYFTEKQPRYVVVQISIQPSDFDQMQRYIAQPPVNFNAFLLAHTPQRVSHLLFEDEHVANNYHVALVRPYDPYYAYYILLERNKTEVSGQTRSG